MKARRINLYHVQERRVNHMILNMDKIQFESRAEIGTIIKALEDWQEDHEKDETVQELINKLDATGKNEYEVVNAARETSFPDLQPPYG